jgi:phage recombination protein Bet
MKEEKNIVFSEPGKPVNYWENKAKIRQYFQKKYDLSERNFLIWCAYGYSLQANPYLEEAIPIVFNKGKENEKLSFVITRDFRVRKAQEQTDYLRHFVVDVCEKDSFQMDVEKGYPNHTYDETSDRGKLKGAWCAVWKKGEEKPCAYAYAKYDHYKKTGKGAEVWDKFPNDQIIKVAEAHGLKRAYTGMFGNTYDSSEVVHENGVIIDAVPDENPYPDEPPALNEKTEPPVTPAEVQEKEKVKAGKGGLFEK